MNRSLEQVSRLLTINYKFDTGRLAERWLFVYHFSDLCFSLYSATISDLCSSVSAKIDPTLENVVRQKVNRNKGN